MVGPVSAGVCGAQYNRAAADYFIEIGQAVMSRFSFVAHSRPATISQIGLSQAGPGQSCLILFHKTASTEILPGPCNRMTRISTPQ